MKYVNVLDDPRTMVMRGRLFSWVAEPRGTIVRVPTWSLNHARGMVGEQVARLATPDGRTYALTAAVTMACQCRCDYCFENKLVEAGLVQRISSETMKPHVLKQTCVFAARMMAKQGKDRSHVELFGGEPLINLAGCYYLLQNLPGLVSASMTTNGVLLTREIALRLAELKLRDLQITFDGAREYHDLVRVMADGRGTYDAILAALESIDDLDAIPGRGFRIHVTPDNIDGLPGLLDDLASRLTPGKYGVNFAPLYDIGAGYDGAQLTGSDAEIQQYIDLFRYAAGKGFRVVPPGEGACSYCKGAFGEGGAVIDTNGRLVPCWDKLGHDEWSVGTIWGGYKDPAKTKGWTACGMSTARPRVEPIQRPEVRWALFELAVGQIKQSRRKVLTTAN